MEVTIGMARRITRTLRMLQPEQTKETMGLHRLLMPLVASLSLLQLIRLIRDGKLYVALVLWKHRGGIFSSFLWMLYLQKKFVVNRQEFLEPGEIVLMASVLKKMQKLTSKKVQLILTSKPRLIYVDPAKLVVKGNIIWSDNPNELSVQAASPSQLKICTVHSLISSINMYTFGLKPWRFSLFCA